MKNIFFWLLVAATPSILYAQNSIEGTVKSITNENLAFANIYFPQIEKGTTTDENGNFSLSNLPSGNFKIISQKPAGSPL